MPPLSPGGGTARRKPRRQTVPVQLAQRQFGPTSGGRTPYLSPRERALRRPQRKAAPQSGWGRATSLLGKLGGAVSSSRRERPAHLFGNKEETLEALDALTGYRSLAAGDPLSVAMLLAPGGSGRLGRFLLSREASRPGSFRNYRGEIGESERANIYNLAEADRPGRTVGSLAFDDPARLGARGMHEIRNQLEHVRLTRDLDEISRNLFPAGNAAYPRLRRKPRRPLPELQANELIDTPGAYVDQMFLDESLRQTPEALRALLSPLSELARGGVLPYGQFANPDLGELWASRMLPLFLRQLGR